MKKDMQLKQMNINYRTMPVFSDRSITASQVAALPSKKNSKKAARKEGTIRIIFMDSVSGSSVADVVMTPIAAEQLITSINQSLDKMNSEVKDMKMQKPTAPVPASDQTYIG